MRERGARVVLLYSDRETRRLRLNKRGEDPYFVEKMLLEDRRSLGYEDVVTPDLEIEATGSPEEIAEEILRTLR
jgi:dephospho-CoA kinase